MTLLWSYFSLIEKSLFIPSSPRRKDPNKHWLRAIATMQPSNGNEGRNGSVCTQDAWYWTLYPSSLQHWKLVWEKAFTSPQEGDCAIFCSRLKKTFTHLYTFLSLNNCFVLSPLNQFSLSTLQKLFPLQIIAAFCFGSTLAIWMFSRHQLLFFFFFLGLYSDFCAWLNFLSLFLLYITHSANWPMLCLVLFPLGSDFKRSLVFMSLSLYLRMESASFI